jgi:hypothetical protein
MSILDHSQKIEASNIPASGLVAIVVRATVIPPSGSISIYGSGPDGTPYPDPVRLSGTDVEAAIPANLPTMYVQMTQGAEDFELDITGYMPDVKVP